MEKYFKIGNVPAILIGEPSDKVYLFVHGKCGSKEEAKDFAKIACERGIQVLGIDLPCHGERKAESDGFNPWTAVPELKSVMEYIKSNWKSVSLRANSIGAWFSMLAFSNDDLDNVLFVSPLISMKNLIGNMMMWAGVSVSELCEKGVIKTDFGEDLDYKYYCYANKNQIDNWNKKTSILYAGKDNLTDRKTVDDFVEKFGCDLTVMENGEHWFHTPGQLAVLDKWTNEKIDG